MIVTVKRSKACQICPVPTGDLLKVFGDRVEERKIAFIDRHSRV